MSTRSLAEQVASVVRHNTSPKQSGVIDRDHVRVILAGNGTLASGDVDRGLELAVEKGLIEERDGGYAPAEV